ncbi:hypothetical protein N7G274_001493 [Stereocaulon virgatum]|uniref:Small acidic protein n=1 Tax=Stereocaulon virgatum TaxID=373712 RepID=A0ABR4AKM1_9LECA
MEDNGTLGVVSEASHKLSDPEWERRQRNREFRVATRREKRDRKADEKKQRKLNATILRRMTKNPDKYNRNAERNRLRDIEGERKRIQNEAIRQVQRLAVIHDPSGAMFNVDPVIKLDDGRVVSVKTLRLQELRAQEKAAAEKTKVERLVDGATVKPESGDGQLPPRAPASSEFSVLPNRMNPERLARLEAVNGPKPPRGLSNKQQKKRAALEPRPAPPRPTIPDNVLIPEGEQNWLALWDLPDEQLERRVLQAKRRKAAERKALRVKQKSGKAERRIARDEKRQIYREMKLAWKGIKEETTKEKMKLQSLEDEELKKIAVDVNVMERQVAMEHCAAIGFTLSNTPGVDEIKPRALGMKGVEVDFDAIEIGESRSDVKLKVNSNRVDLGSAPKDERATFIPTSDLREGTINAEEFIKLDIGKGEDFEMLNYNYKLRKKLRRAMDNAEIQKESLVRQRTIDYYKKKGMDTPPILKTALKPVITKGQRILENGLFETAKQERARARIDLAEFNTQMRVLRKQAKDASIHAGLRKYAEVTGKVAPSGMHIENEEIKDAAQVGGTDILSTPEISLTTTTPEESQVGMKRIRPDSDDTSTSDGDDQPERAPGASSLTSISSDGKSPKSGDEAPATKRQKLQSGDSDSRNVQSESMNSDRQAMIAAESERLAKTQNRKNRRQPYGNGSLKEVDANLQDRFRGWQGKGANAASNWNVNGLSGEMSRKSKFLRLLGGEKSGSNAKSAGLRNSDRSADRSAKINADLEMQYDYGISYKKDSKRKGLGS